MVISSRYHSPMKRDNPLTNIQSYTCARLSENSTGDKTKCERTKCECEASVTANQRVTKHKQHERQKTKCAQNIHGANNSAYITTGGMGVFLTRAAFSVSHGCNGMNRGKNA